MQLADKSKIKGIIFDLGSTLIEYENIPWDKMNLMALRAGYDNLENSIVRIPSFDQISEEYIKIRDRSREQAGKSLEEWTVTDKIAELFESVGIGNDRLIVDNFFSHYYKVVADQLTIFDDTINVLDKIKRAGLNIGLVSNTIFPEPYHIRDLSRFGILEYFNFLIFSSSFGFRKPHRSIYDKAIELSGLKADQLIFVGDRYIEDYLGPRDNGIFSILKIRQGREYPSPIPENTVKIKSLTELLPFVNYVE